MHIVTGLILAKLLGPKRKGPASLVTRFRTGPVRTVHWMPGRVRFRAEVLSDDGALRDVVAEKLGAIDGVSDIAVSGATGSVLIAYREETVKPELLFAALVRLLGFDAELDRTPRPALTREIGAVMESLNRAVYEQTGGLLDFRSATMIVLAAIGIRQLATEGARGFPPGFTLLWWAANSLLGRRAD